jgi:hypothetical protein
LYGRPVVSSEVWTWVHSPSFRATPLDLKGEAHEHLLNGINQLVGHGWPYSPSDAPGLGWFFYAAGAIDDRNPWWPAVPELTAYLRRMCWLLQQGQPVADVAVYLPNEDLFAQMGSAVGGSLDPWREAQARVGAVVPTAVREAGLDYDLVDDDALGVTPVDRYPVVVVPATTTVPAATAEWLARAASGGTVITVGSPVEVPGAVRLPGPDQLPAALAAAIQPDLGVAPASPDVGFVHRQTGDADVYVVINTGPARLDVTITPRAERAHVAEWDPATGAVRRSAPSTGGIPVTLDAYQASVIVLTDQPSAEPPPAKTELSGTSAEPVLLAEGWQVRYGDGDPQPVQLPHIWEDEPARRHYSGSATYRTTVELDPAPDQQVIIEFGASAGGESGLLGHVGMVGPSYRAAVRPPVGEVASVVVNDVDCGVLWAPPYRLDVTRALRPGTNTIEITVANTAANALAADEHIAALAEQSEQRYGRRFRMQQLDRAMDTVRSGLLAVPTLTRRAQGAANSTSRSPR